MSRRSSIVSVVVLATVVAGLVLAHTGGGRLRDYVLALHGQPSGHAARAHRRQAGTPAPAWPQTKAGELARRWALAFGSGEDAMRTFLGAELAASSLERRSLEERLDTYRSWHTRFRTLTLEDLGESNDARLQATLVDADGAPYAFTFEAQAEAPFKLVAVTLLEVRTHAR